MNRRYAVLFLGEMLLVPHLWPVIPALTRLDPDADIDCWIATGVHARLLRRLRDEAGLTNDKIRMRRAPFYRNQEKRADGENPDLPTKLPVLTALAPQLRNADAVLCAEQTSLWLPRLLGRLLPPFVKTSHGVGSISKRDDPRRRAARLLLVPSEKERQTYLDRGFDPEKVRATGYVKSAMAGGRPISFPTEKPTILYAPHWRPQVSSWWKWGRKIVEMLAAQDEYNVILAPHQRLFEKDEAAAAVIDKAAQAPNVIADTGSWSMVDGSYTQAADIYLGDASSQLVEYLARPRPAVFLNAQGLDWQSADDREFWNAGEVVNNIDQLWPALRQASARHGDYVAFQTDYANASLGPDDGLAPERVARALIEVAQ